VLQVLDWILLDGLECTMLDHHIVPSWISINVVGIHPVRFVSEKNNRFFFHGQLCKIRLDIRNAVPLPFGQGCCGSPKTGHGRIW